MSPPPDFLEAIVLVKSLIFTIGATPDYYLRLLCPLQILMYTPAYVYVHLFNTQHIYKLQQYTIPLLLPSGQRTMHSGLLRPIHTYTQHIARRTDEKLNEWIPIVRFILARSREHAARSTRHEARSTEHG